MAFNLPDLRKNPAEITRARRSGYLGNLLEDFFNDFYSPFSPALTKGEGDLSPKVDISETESEYKLEAELPGVNLTDIEVKIDNNILTIKGKKEEDAEKKEKNYYMRERYVGSFQRSIALPNNIREDNIDAKFKNGILHIVIPKKNQDTIKKIEVKSN